MVLHPGSHKMISFTSSSYCRRLELRRFWISTVHGLVFEPKCSKVDRFVLAATRVLAHYGECNTPAIRVRRVSNLFLEASQAACSFMCSYNDAESSDHPLVSVTINFVRTWQFDRACDFLRRCTRRSASSIFLLAFIK